MIIDLIIIGLAITLEPIPLTAFILVLASRGGVRKGAAFIFGWLLSLAVETALGRGCQKLGQPVPLSNLVSDE